jgi:hypothetical protein
MNKRLSKLNNIVLGLKILSIVAFGVVLVPVADAYHSNNPGSSHAYGDNGPSYNNNYYNNSIRPNPNPVPILYSSTPNLVTDIVGNMAIILTGANFVPGSIAQWDNSTRATNYVSPTSLTVILSASDLSQDGKHVISVFNPAPSGGNSNGITFTVMTNVMTNPSVPSAINNSNTLPDPSSYFQKTYDKQAKTPRKVLRAPADEEKLENNNLVAGAISSQSGFMNFSLIQWLILVILILLIVVLVRKIYLLDSPQHETHLKHE